MTLDIDTAQTLKKYREIITLNKKEPRFNILAFIFNSFYYLYSHLSFWWWLLYFLATPIIFMSLILFIVPAFSDTQSDSVALLLLILSALLVRTVAGFRFNIDHKKYMQKFVDKYKDVELTEEDLAWPPVKYFSISPVRLFTLSVITCGIYNLYWSYKNWEAIRNDTENDNVHPFLYGYWFNFIASIPLFKQMKRSFLNTDTETTLTQLGYVLYILFYASLILCIRVFEPLSLWYYFAFAIVMALSLLPIQKTINDHNQKLDPKAKPMQSFLPGEKLITTISVITLLFAAYGEMYEPIPLTSDQITVTEEKTDTKEEKSSESPATVTEKKINKDPAPIRVSKGEFSPEYPLYLDNLDSKTQKAIQNYYVMKDSYVNMCKKYGVTLKKYPVAFDKYYSNVYNDIQKKLAKRNSTIEQVLDIVPQELMEGLDKLVELNTELLVENFQATIADFCNIIEEDPEEAIKDILGNPEKS